jgi:micrococcal nuclease
MENSGSPREPRVRRRFPLRLTILLLAALYGAGQYAGDLRLQDDPRRVLQETRIAASQAYDRMRSAPPRQQTSSHGRLSGTVTRIIDGDTFIASFSDRPIRVWGLDAPEANQAGGAAATAELTRLAAGRLAVCEIRDIDRYNRLVGQCFLPGGVDITAAMIRAGVAREYCHFSRNYYGTCRGQ